jgi:hypothetical protein
MKKINKLGEKLHTPTWLFILLIIVFVLRIPSFFEPYSHSGEMLHLALGEAIKQGVPLYSGIYGNQPPLLYLMAAIAENLFWFKAILTFWIIITIYIFWKLTEFLFPSGSKTLKDQKVVNQKTQIVATCIFALLTTIPLLEGNVVNAELFMIGPTIAAFLILLSKRLTPKNLFLSGVLFSTSTLFKATAFFDIPAIIFLWITGTKVLKLKPLKSIVKNSAYIFIGLATPIVLTLAWLFLQGAVIEYVTAAFLHNIVYPSWKISSPQGVILTKNLSLTIRGLIVLVALVFLFRERFRLSKSFIFATAWLLFSLFAVTLSGQPQTHHLIQSIAPFSILIAILFTQKTIEQVLVIIPLTLFFFIPFYYKYWYYPTLPYYEKFSRLVLGKYSKDQYFATFGPDVNRNYRISEFITPAVKRGEKIFVWGKDSSSIYTMTKRLPPGKYLSDHQIKNLASDQETVSSLKNDLPVFIILLPSSSEISGMQKILNSNYGFVENIDGAEIWKLLKPQVRSSLSF